MNEEKEIGKYVGKSKVLPIPVIIKVCELMSKQDRTNAWILEHFKSFNLFSTFLFVIYFTSVCELMSKQDRSKINDK